MRTSNKIKWESPPAMEQGSPSPEVRLVRDLLQCTYRCANPEFPGWDSGESAEHPGFDEYFAVLEFHGVQKYSLGTPNHNTLHNDVLYKYGVRLYDFCKLSGVPELANYPTCFYWVVAFHDETLKVVAQNGVVKFKRVNACLGSQVWGLIDGDT